MRLTLQDIKKSNRNSNHSEEIVIKKNHPITHPYLCRNSQTELNSAVQMDAKNKVKEHSRVGSIITDQLLQELSLRCRLGKQIDSNNYEAHPNKEARELFKTAYISHFNTIFCEKFSGITWAGRMDYLKTHNAKPENQVIPTPTVAKPIVPRAPVIIVPHAPVIVYNPSAQIISETKTSPTKEQITLDLMLLYRDDIQTRDRIHSLLESSRGEQIPEFFTNLFSTTIRNQIAQYQIIPDYLLLCGLDVAHYLLKNKNNDNSINLQLGLNTLFKECIKKLRQYKTEELQIELLFDFIDVYIEHYKKIPLIIEANTLSDQYPNRKKWLESFFKKNPHLQKEFETHSTQIHQAILSENAYDGTLSGEQITTLLAKQVRSQYLEFVLTKIISVKRQQPVPIAYYPPHPPRPPQIGVQIVAQVNHPQQPRQILLNGIPQRALIYPGNPQPERQQPFAIAYPPHLPQIVAQVNHPQQPRQILLNGIPQPLRLLPIIPNQNQRPVLPQPEAAQQHPPGLLNQPRPKPAPETLAMAKENYSQSVKMPDYLQLAPEENYILHVSEAIMLRALDLLIQAYPDAVLDVKEMDLLILVMSYYFNHLIKGTLPPHLTDALLNYFESRKSLIYGTNNQLLGLIDNLPLYLATTEYPSKKIDIDPFLKKSSEKLIQIFFGQEFSDLASRLTGTPLRELVQYGASGTLHYFLLPIVFSDTNLFIERVRNNKVQFIEQYDQLVALFPKNELLHISLNKAFKMRYKSSVTNHSLEGVNLAESTAEEFNRLTKLLKTFIIRNPSSFGITSVESSFIDAIDAIDSKSTLLAHLPTPLNNIKTAFFVMHTINSTQNNDVVHKYRSNLLIKFLSKIEDTPNPKEYAIKLRQLAELQGQCPVLWTDTLALVNDQKNEYINPMDDPKTMLNQLMDDAINQASRIVFNKKNLFNDFVVTLTSEYTKINQQTLISGNFLLESHFISFLNNMAVESKLETYNDIHLPLVFSKSMVTNQLNDWEKSLDKEIQDADAYILKHNILPSEDTIEMQQFNRVVQLFPEECDWTPTNSKMRHSTFLKIKQSAIKMALENDLIQISRVLEASIPIIGIARFEIQKKALQLQIKTDYSKLNFYSSMRVTKSERLSDNNISYSTYKERYCELYKKEILRSASPNYSTIEKLDSASYQLDLNYRQITRISSALASAIVLPIAIHNLHKQMTDASGSEQFYNSFIKLLEQIPANKGKKIGQLTAENFEVQEDNYTLYSLKFTSFLLILINSKLLTLDQHEEFFPNQFKPNNTLSQTGSFNEEKSSGSVSSIQSNRSIGSSLAAFFKPKDSLTQQSNRVEDKGYIRHEVEDNGDCGYTAFGIVRKEALALITANVYQENIKTLLKAGVKEALLTDQFIEYLISNEIIPMNMPMDTIEKNIEQMSSDEQIIKSYLLYDIKEEKIDLGWAHPCILQALAHIQNKSLYIWQREDNGLLIPHKQNEYARYLPNNNQNNGRTDLLFINGNHFELLEIIGGFDGDLYPLNHHEDSSEDENMDSESKPENDLSKKRPRDEGTYSFFGPSAKRSREEDKEDEKFDLEL